MIKRKNFLIIFVYYYLSVFLWLGLIFYLSSIPGLKSGASLSTEIFLRKLAHISEYLILAFLFWRVFIFRLKFSLPKAKLVTFFCCFSYAISDEFHQFFVQNRSGCPFDVLVDSIGIIGGIFLFSLISKIKKNR
jgi:VanZ family protein